MCTTPASIEYSLNLLESLSDLLCNYTLVNIYVRGCQLVYINSICTPFANFAESIGRGVFPSESTACIVNNVLQNNNNYVS